MKDVEDLVTWLRAQLDEDERVAQAAGGCEWQEPAIAPGETDWEGDLDAERAHTIRHDPARVLREVEAKRWILDLHAPMGAVALENACNGCGFEWGTGDPVTWNIDDCPVLHALASVYADRPGYQESWRP